MGIINLTPDSFYDGGKWENQNQIYENLKNWEKAGVKYVDVGCESSRPGSKKITISQETERLNEFLEVLKDFPNLIFSIDTSKPQVAHLALKNGFSIVNDIYGGGINGEMFEIVKSFNAKIVIMHMKGDPEDMQVSPSYSDVVEEIKSFFSKKINLAISKGLTVNRLILDPGIGFGKRIVDNDKILGSLDKLKSFGIPLLIGCSRKSFLSINKDKPEERLSTSLAAMTISILKGAKIIRVHDVEESIKVKSFIERYMASNLSNMEIEHEC